MQQTQTAEEEVTRVTVDHVNSKSISTKHTTSSIEVSWTMIVGQNLRTTILHPSSGRNIILKNDGEKQILAHGHSGKFFIR